jgi:GNAT superfamily N-acetyltransferase
VTDPPPLYDAPEPLTEAHDRAEFHSGEPSLDRWLRERALMNMASGATKTYALCPRGSRRVIGYYGLAMGRILHQEVPGSMRRNMPAAIPAVMLGRLAVDVAWRGKGLGGALLSDAITRSRRAAEVVAARLVVVHAISAEAEAFYRHYGFTRLPVATPSLALDLVKLARTVQ